MKDNEIWDERSRLLYAYMQELASMDNKVPCTTGAVAYELLGYRAECEKGYGEWNDIFADDKLVGFLMVCKAPNCHPDADWFIEEAYVTPEYRKAGLMTKAVKEQIARKPGRYCMFILEKNLAAKVFWMKLFTVPKSGLSYEEYPLRDVGACRPGLMQYGFKPKTRRKRTTNDAAN